MTTSDPPVKSVRTTLEILDALKELERATVTEVAEYVEIPVSTASDHLQTLSSYKCTVVKENHMYRIGPGLIEFAGYARSSLDLFKISRPELDKLARETGEHANLIIEDQGGGRVIYQAMGEDAVQQVTHIGATVPLHASALGKALLAFMPEERSTALLEKGELPKITEHTITDPDDLRSRLDEVRERGYATDTGENIKGMNCIGVPIKDYEDSVVGAISVSGPAYRMTGDRFQEEIPHKVLETANVIEINLNQSL